MALYFIFITVMKDCPRLETFFFFKFSCKIMNYWPRPPLKAIFLVQLGTFFNLSERKEMSVNIAEVFQQGSAFQRNIC